MSLFISGGRLRYDSHDETSWPVKYEQSESEDEGVGGQEEIAHYELQRGRINLGIGKNYVPEWSGQDAFREAYQNWYSSPAAAIDNMYLRIILISYNRRDGILKSFDIDISAFRPTIRENTREIAITVYKVQDDGDSSPLLAGFITYDKPSGKTTLSNFQARLEAKHLSMGESSKRSDDNLAGHHGEGMKLAALVLRRLGYSVRIETSSFYWNFNFGRRDILCCTLSEPLPAVLQKKKAAFADQVRRAERLLKGNMWEDVTFILSKGREILGRKIEEADFRQWITVALDLDAPDHDAIVRTERGDLILGPDYSGRVYLKGIRVAGHGPDGRKYKYGYNLPTGRINRDRERMMNQNEEAQTIAEIWRQSILKEGDKITDAYLELFHEHEDCPDIAFSELVLKRWMTTKMWQRLLTKSNGLFFYAEGDSEENPLDSQVNYYPNYPPRHV